MNNSQQQKQTPNEQNQKKHKNTLEIFIHAQIASLGSFYSGYALGELNMALEKLDIAYDIINSKYIDLYNGFLTGAVPLGAALGCLLSGILLSKFGRRQLFMYCDFLGIILGFIFLIQNFQTAVIVRFIMGLLVGINSTVVPLYIREISPVILNSQTHELSQNIVKNTYKPQYIEEIIQEIQAETTAKKNQNDTFTLIFSKQYRSRLKLGSIISLFQQTCGINAIVFYSSKIFLEATGNKILANYMTVFSGLILIVFTFNASFFTKKYGRKTIFQFGHFFLMFLLLLISISLSFSQKQQNNSQQQNQLQDIQQEQQSEQNEEEPAKNLQFFIIFLIYLHLMTFSLSIGPVTWIYNADFLNSEKALGFCTAVNWSCTFLIGLFIPTLQNLFGISNLFLVFAVLSLGSFIYITLFAKETFGLNQQQIVQIFADQCDKIELQNINTAEDKNEEEEEDSYKQNKYYIE
ncbi:Major facilitator superfamily domain, general substrate transporter [Pseudocohnilembus persalinus]|uniref:Hexose transporter 1 n=1 Tax=Pseudocohnilembus persalinus TaxID=266149 RepID=A0A0V0Q8W1_PSEPJ|nr:Major facilitator superfamily domain, general substrate transporter [Pseudocohnilembus persalinus]|eukprot:KRW98638.1 Major facilitator superfamily domain, general substrate transporter [Pseudocohnilembus persalinus]